MTWYFDSHCHLSDAAFRDDREAVFRRAAEAGVTHVVTIASTVADARQALALARSREGLWCTVGVHPHEAGGAEPGVMDEVRSLAEQNPEIVAIGETGLDFYYDNAPRSVQRDLFHRHLELAADLDLPAVVHAREADHEVAAALRGMPAGTSGVLHCFTGGDKAFEEAMRAGWYVSFSGIASFKSFGAVDLLRTVPLDRLLIETDAPYLSPVPLRGRRNEPSHLPHVARAVAEHRGMDPTELAERTAENACRFYRVTGESQTPS